MARPSKMMNFSKWSCGEGGVWLEGGGSKIGDNGKQFFPCLSTETVNRRPYRHRKETVFFLQEKGKGFVMRAKATGEKRRFPFLGEVSYSRIRNTIMEKPHRKNNIIKGGGYGG